MLSLPAQPRILIVRLSAIGDVLHGLPVANALRDALPQAHIAWVVEGRTAELLRGHRAIDQVIQIPRRWLKSPRTAWQVRNQLRAARCDVAIDLQGLTKSAVAAWLSGARCRIGFAGPAGRELSPWLNNLRVTPRQTHVVDRNLELLTPLGITHPAACFDLQDQPADAQSAAQMVRGLLGTERFAVLNPGAGWPSKLWPAPRFAAVARHLAQAHGLKSLVVWAGDAEHALARQIVAESAGAALLAPPTRLGELAAIARRGVLFVASDTGPLHLAVAVGTPCVGLFGPMPAERNGPYGPAHIAVQRVCLQGTSRERRTANGDSMAAISVADVTTACDTILGRAAIKRTA